MVIQIRNTSDPKDVWCEFTEKEGHWIDEDGERPSIGIEFALENLKEHIQSEQLYKDAHESI